MGCNISFRAGLAALSIVSRCMEIVLHLYFVLYWLLAVALNHSLVGSGRAGGTHAEIMESHGTSGADINDQPPDVRTMITFV